MDLESMKSCIRRLLVALDFLRSECRIIRTDLQLKNLLLPAPDATKLSSFEDRAVSAPSSRKVLKDRTIYTSPLFPPGKGLPLVSDFGEARFGDEEHNEDIMPNAYRAPEVIFKMKWDYKVDIWNVAMVAWDIVSSHTLFNGRNPDGIFDDRVHLAELVALLGPPPPEFRERSHLKSIAADIKGEDKEGFLRWLRAALQWLPEDRPTATEL
ncbi:hypothetical protein AJ80_05407 [Polytolypa hystricis UAMH7299]|uniref:Protein kinase domain-containing protein n=1 Tax=Polytolypa hystricis (strain UAMH7299) TaxID=1447883 RepID=A0A2B7Y308_POLH7|nr:hypothetical protein AJ80_05407 [Polytolypa hystricis UAMH7299]